MRWLRKERTGGCQSDERKWCRRMNTIQIIGRLTKDPEVRWTKTGKTVTTFTVAVSRSEKQTDYINVVTWEQMAESCGNQLCKGRLVLVVGRLQTRSYETADGQKRYVSEIVASLVAPNIFENEKTERAESSGFGQEPGDEEIPF